MAAEVRIANGQIEDPLSPCPKLRPPSSCSDRWVYANKRSRTWHESVIRHRPATAESMMTFGWSAIAAVRVN